jgi:hypothetical protein
LNELVDPVNQIVGAATAIGDAFANSFKGLVTGATTAREAMRNFFSSLADYFADMAAKMIAEALKMQAIKLLTSLLSGVLGAAGSGISGAGNSAGAAAFGGFGPTFNTAAFSTPQLAGRANGGPVTAQQPYMVGERGPELFVPATSGSVVSNADTRAALAQQAVSRDSNDTRSALKEQAANSDSNDTRSALKEQAANSDSNDTRSALKEQIANRQMNAGSVAVQQKPIEVKYQSTVINNVEYVTRREAEQIGQVAATRGADLAQKRLKNNPTARRAVGIS